MSSHSIFKIIALCCVSALCTSAAFSQNIRSVLRDPNIDWKDPLARAQAVAAMQAIKERDRNLARSIAQARGLPLRQKLANGRLLELIGLDETGELVYFATRNDRAAISSGASLLNAFPYELDGAGITVGVWDGGTVMENHREFNDGATSRIILEDTTGADDHATHVAGTIAAYGVTAEAKGMANQAFIASYDWNQDTSEMIAAGASDAGQHGTRVYISNHSYGTVQGWTFYGSYWGWEGARRDENGYEPDFGQYSEISEERDTIAYNAPYYLMVWAAGNDGTDGPREGDSIYLGWRNFLRRASYDSDIHPPSDGDYRNGFETISDSGIAKNLLTIGAANDAITNGQRDPSKSTIASFSSTGPTDDGRIKPDLVGNGVGLFSPVSGGRKRYGNSSGTSMASPNVTGSAALLIELYQDLFGAGAAMRASTLKGLLIHTASDIGNPGPDYTYGWGLVDVKSAADLLTDVANKPETLGLVEDQVSTNVNTQNYSFFWDGSSPIRATLSWTDPAGASTNNHDSRTPRLVNDLNLKVIAPDGSEFFPFVMPFVGQWTVESMSEPATTGTNNVDNVEQVVIPNPAQFGEWRIEVSYAGSLTNDVQDFGLIVSGSGDSGGNLFAAWIASQDVGVLSGLGDDPDGDGNHNGAENFYGTHAGIPSKGLETLWFSSDLGQTMALTHPLNPNPAPDLSATYEWSKDLKTFHRDGETDSEGTRVSFTREEPVDDHVTVLATIEGPEIENIFVRVRITRDPAD